MPFLELCECKYVKGARFPVAFLSFASSASGLATCGLTEMMRLCLSLLNVPHSGKGFPYAADFSAFLVRVGGGDAPGSGLASLTNPPSKGVAVAALVPSLSQYGTFYFMPFTHHVDFTLVLAFGNEGGEYVFEENDG